MRVSGSRIPAIARKEMQHILRDPRSLWIIFMLPNILMLLFGYAIDLDLKNVRLALCDRSRTPASRSLAESLEASDFFSITVRIDDPGAAEDLFRRRAVRAAIVIPEDFARDLERGRGAEVGVVIDGSDANSASLVQNYLETFLAGGLWRGGGGAADPAARSGGARGGGLAVRPVVLYNRAMDSTNFIVPGLVALVMMMLGALLTSVTIVRERETGTMEQILVSPVRSHEVVLGKVLPYLFLAFGVAAMIIVVGHFWFKVPFAGSRAWLMLACAVYLFTALSLGLLVSTLVSTQQVAMMLSLLLTMLPTLMLSGFIFPVASMPRALQYVSYALPATHFLVIIRGVMLKGSSPADLWTHLAVTAGIGLALVAIVMKRFSLKLGRNGG
jgi:ABC-2 type transport system permease protein